MKISFVFPMFNEIGNIERVIRSTHDVARRIVDEFEIIVVDDASTDGCGELAEKMRAEFAERRVFTMCCYVCCSDCGSATRISRSSYSGANSAFSPCAPKVHSSTPNCSSKQRIAAGPSARSGCTIMCGRRELLRLATRAWCRNFCAKCSTIVGLVGAASAR